MASSACSPKAGSPGPAARSDRSSRGWGPARLGKAPVLLLWIHGTPESPTAFGSILRRSRSRVEVVGVFDLRAEKDPQVASDTLRQALLDHTGWKANEESVVDRWEREVAEGRDRW